MRTTSVRALTRSPEDWAAAVISDSGFEGFLNAAVSNDQNLVDGVRRGDVKRVHLPEQDLKLMQVLIGVGVGAPAREGALMLTVAQGNTESNEASEGIPLAGGGSLLDQIVRDGARQMLAAALHAEVAAYVEAHADQLDADGHRLVVRNGFHRPREVATAAGAVPVRAPRVNDKRVEESTRVRARFASAILPAWARKSPQVAEVLPLLYLHGLSSNDFAPCE